MLDGICEEQITRNLSTVEAIASEVDITMSQLEDKIDCLNPNDKRRLIIILEKNKNRTKSYAYIKQRKS